MRTHIVRARADVVATKLGIILPSSFFLSFHILFSQKGFTYDFEFLHAFLGNTIWVALMIQLGKFVGGGGVADTNYLYPARWGWINYLF